MKRIQTLNNGDSITINLFGKEQEIEVICTGDNQFNETGDYKEEGFAFNEAEISCLNWFLKNIDIADYKKEIVTYCNEQYDDIGDKQITEDDLENEVYISAIAINISKITQSIDGHLYPEISFLETVNVTLSMGFVLGFEIRNF